MQAAAAWLSALARPTLPPPTLDGHQLQTPGSIPSLHSEADNGIGAAIQFDTVTDFIERSVI